MSDIDKINEIAAKSYHRKHAIEEEFLARIKPLKEFSIERDGELVEYGVWQGNNEDDLMIMFKVDGKYRFSNKMFYDKPIVRELCQIL